MESWIDRQAQMDFAVNKAMKQGLKQGLEQGLEQGIKQGSTQSRMEIARAMLALGLGHDVICKSTGLSEEDLGRLGSA